MQRTARSLAAPLALTTVAALVLTACGQDDSEPTASSAPTAAADPGVVDEESAALVPEELRDQTLTIPMMDGNPPYSFIDDAGETIGFNVDFAEAVMDRLGLEHGIVTTKFDTIVPGLQSGRYAVTFLSLNPTPERLEIIDVVPYTKTQVALIDLADSGAAIAGPEDVCGQDVVTVSASSQYEELVTLDEECAAAGLEPIAITQLPGTSEVTLAVKSGRASFGAIAAINAAYMASQDEEISVQPFKFGGAVTGVATTQDSPLADAIASALNGMIEDGSYLEILERWDIADMALEEITVQRSGS